MNCSVKHETIPLFTFSDHRGNLTSYDNFLSEESRWARVFFIHSPKGRTIERGGHAHVVAKQLIFCVVGEIVVYLDDGYSKCSHRLTPGTCAVEIPAGVWSYQNYVGEAVSCVLTSENYAEADYLRSFKDYLDWKATSSK